MATMGVESEADSSAGVSFAARDEPLLEGASRLIVNGDAVDTRPGPAPELTAALRREIVAFFHRECAATQIESQSLRSKRVPHTSINEHELLSLALVESKYPV